MLNDKALGNEGLFYGVPAANRQPAKATTGSAPRQPAKATTGSAQRQPPKATAGSARGNRHSQPVVIGSNTEHFFGDWDYGKTFHSAGICFKTGCMADREGHQIYKGYFPAAPFGTIETQEGNCYAGGGGKQGVE